MRIHQPVQRSLREPLASDHHAYSVPGVADVFQRVTLKPKQVGAQPVDILILGVDLDPVRVVVVG